MRKAFTSLLFFFAIGILGFHNCQAQQTIWAEDFTYIAQQNFFGQWQAIGTSVPWTCDLVYLIGTVCFPYTGNDTKVAGVSSYDIYQGSLCGQQRHHETNVLLMAPPVSLPSNAWFKYDSYFLQQQANGKTECATVEITTDNGLTWTVLKSPKPVKLGDKMNTNYIDLSAYANSSIRLGFRYTDSAQYMNGWMIDNLKIFVPAQNDAALVQLEPGDSLQTYFGVPSAVGISGTIMNNGLQPIQSLDIAYREANGSIQNATITGLNITSFDTAHFLHSIPYSLGTMGSHNLKVWTALSGDTIHRNDTLPMVIHGAKFFPIKKLAVEEGTGTWNLYGPRGSVYLHALDASDNPPTRISIHSGDVMDNKAYADYMYGAYQQFIPYFFFDRREYIYPEMFFAKYEIQKNNFGFADIQLSAKGYGGQISVDANILPAIDLSGNFRLALVITEDGVKGSTIDYAQKNAYAHPNQGAMGGYESLPDPVPASQMSYDYVARTITPGPEGGLGCLPTAMAAGGTYSCNLKSTYSLTSNFAKLKAVVLLIREKDSSILNSATVGISALGVNPTAKNNFALYTNPNPSDQQSILNFQVPTRMQISFAITDITGHVIYQNPTQWFDAGPHHIPFQTAQWPTGMYFLNMSFGQSRESIKLSVVH